MSLDEFVGLCCSARDLMAKLGRGEEFLLLDVRAPQELACARVDPCTNIPLNELPKRLGEIEAWRDKEVVTMCHHGMRSEMAQRFLVQQGFRRVINLLGGIDSYAEAVPEVGRY
jgi:rhodanese-related sulfurtransferase